LASLLAGLLLSGLFGRLIVAGAQAGAQAGAPAEAQTGASPTAQPTQPAVPLQVRIVASPHLADKAGQAPEDASIWTDELLSQAKPYPMPAIPAGLQLPPAAPDGPPGWAPAVPPDGPERDFLGGFTSRVATPDSDITYLNPNSYSLFPFKAVGRVFFKIGADTYACSASVIGEYAIWTAGHCVHPGNGDPNGWYSPWVFIPAYKDYSRPYGTWQADYIYTTDQWMNGGGYEVRYDYAVVIVKPLNGLTIRQTVGKLGFAWNQPVDQARVDMGYPMEPSPQFDGQKQVISTAAGAFPDPNFPSPPTPLGIPSMMKGGASGGPWMLNHAITSAPGFNLLNGENSYMYSGYDVIYSSYFGNTAKDMYECATQSTPTYMTCGSEAELALRQSARSTVQPGELFTYTLVAENWGALDAHHLVLTDTIPAGAAPITASLPGGTCSWLNRNIFCLLTLFPRWTTITATVAVSAPLQTGASVNLAGVRSDQNDFTPLDNTGVPLTVMVGEPIFLPAIRR
jgi:uncharacterized repeat protein (TIGR01451 family)